MTTPETGASAPPIATSRSVRLRPSQKSEATLHDDVEVSVVASEIQLHVALDNMPGALVYTDDKLNIVFCNDRFREMYPVPHELLEPGRPYPAFLRFLAENGYYGEGDSDALVSGRIDSLRNPSGQSFEDSTPDGRVYRILRRRIEAGGVVTVMTDMTEQKEAEDQLRKAKLRADTANELVTEKNTMLEALSSKLSKYLSPQIYHSIFEWRSAGRNCFDA
jgi:PAS domain-containing protein